ncbi:MAG: hypothetical protein LV481_09895 [Methylacidiphilales bacterium]|nr:hypothetical protein [Candidatus Methylacidiphilales bacterium]
MSLPRALLYCCLLVSVSFPALGGTWTPDPSLGNVDQHRRLYEIARHYCEVNFDPDANLVGTPCANPPNKKHHGTGGSCAYAYTLLLTGDPADQALAQKILKRVLACQDTNPASPTCGAFDWYTEDAKPGDLNSAPFVGGGLAGILDLDRQRPCLDPDVRSAVQNAVRLAVGAVMRRDVDPGYTNIAFISTALAAAGEKLLAVPGAGAWAQAKLDAIMALADDGEFAEYLSPTYTAVALDGAYACRRYAFSDAFSAKADAAINHLWKQVALAYHAPTYQLGGPFLRAYGDDMLEYCANLKYWIYLATDGAYPLPDTDTAHDWGKAGLASLAAQAVAPRPEFQLPHAPWREWNAVGSGTTPVRHLSQYREGNFILGTVAFQDEWKQKRNLVAYWRNDGPPPLGMSVGFCLDESNESESIPGIPGEKIHFYSKQVKDAALVALATTAPIPGRDVSTLVFNGGAVMDDKGVFPFRIQDGTITAYLYPVTNGSVQFATQLNTNPVSNGQDYFNVRPVPYRISRVMRFWDSADSIGNVHIMSYVIVFRPSDQLPPKVSDLALKTDANGISASARVDGADLSVSFKN